MSSATLDPPGPGSPLPPPVLDAPPSISPVPARPKTPPRWGWPLAEAGVVAVSVVLGLWALDQNGYGNSYYYYYYAAAARSMTASWHNFIFGVLDPGGWITVDKPPLALWLHAGAAKLFGYSSWSLLAPSALAGAGAVWLLMVTVRRVWGRPAGIAAGLSLALMPVLVAVSRSNNPDAVLVLCVVAAAWATERAIATGRFRWIALAAGFVGLGFLDKLLAAAIIMPPLFLAYLVAGPRPWSRRLLHLVGAGAVFLVVAFSWVALHDLSPASSRSLCRRQHRRHGVEPGLRLRRVRAADRPQRWPGRRLGRDERRRWHQPVRGRSRHHPPVQQRDG